MQSFFNILDNISLGYNLQNIVEFCSIITYYRQNQLKNVKTSVFASDITTDI